MYIIDSSYEMPDIQYMYDRISAVIEEGIAIKNLKTLYTKVSDSREAAKKNLKSLYGIENPNSPTQILNYFQNIMNDDIVTACCKNNKWTTNKDAMKELAVKGYQDAIDLIAYRKAKKYCESVEEIIYNTYKDGRVRPEITLGKTNRINYAKPAIMNIPKPLLWHIISPREPGNILVSIDIKNQEPWIMINMLNIQTLKDILEEEQGLYEAIFQRIFDRPCNPIERDELKVAWNAMTYGATMFGLNAICRYTDAKRIYEFFSSIKELKEYRGKCYGRAKKNMQEVKTYFGNIVRADTYGPGLQRVLMDIPIQGTGSDILALLIKHFDEEAESLGLQDVITLVYSRHDELILEIDKSYAEEEGLENVYKVLADIFEHKVDDWEPFKVKIGEVKPAELFIDGNLYDPEDED